MLQFLKNIFDSNEKQIRKMQPLVDKIVTFEEEFASLTDQQLRDKTDEFRKYLGVDVDNPISARTQIYDKKAMHKKLMEILPESFAVVREMASRKTNHKHFPVQLMAGITLATNKVSELFTGEGKTNAANLPLYLYALTGRGAHLVTVNDYLARRDGEWNGHILSVLGISVGVVNSGTQFRFITDEEAVKLKGDEAKKAIEDREKRALETGRLKLDQMEGVNLVEVSKKEVYDCDIVFGTNNEFGFDYLRDNMSRDLRDVVQGPLHYAIVDEADSILIDEARTPLIISQSASAANDMYRKFASVVNQLKKEEHYTVDEKSHSVSINDLGIDRVEKILNVQNAYEDGVIAYHLENALKAKELYNLDDQYIVRDGEILIVDEFTGRVLPGRRYSEGLHQAIEAKESVEVNRESQTLATITLQNYFRLYDFLAGMTATALTEAEELAKIYKLDVVVVPTNSPVVRKDYTDVVYKNQEGKFRAIVEEIKEHNAKGQPMLVGTASVERSEMLSNMLTKEGIKHNVLNAKNHEREAQIVQTAGQQGQVTIATNMAGRGTDIALEEGVKALGGLYVIGTERHESRRIDNQLRGRSGRQGDPGMSRFFVSFEDELMRIFGGDRMKLIMNQVGLEDDMPISMGILGKTIENAQKKVEAYNYDIRKRLVDYDDVLNNQREIIYTIRRKLLELSANLDISDVKESKQVISDEFLQNLDLNVLFESLDGFSLGDKDSWKLQPLEELPWLNKPINLWILKRIVNSVRNLVSAQLTDDMKISNVEERKVVAHINSILTSELVDQTVKRLGYKDTVEFYRALETQNPLDHEMSLLSLTVSAFLIRTTEIGEFPMTQMAKLLILQSVDNFWMEHLDAMATLRDGISMRSLAQKDPLVEYKNEGYLMFENLLAGIDESVVSRFFKVKVVRENAPKTPLQTVKEEATNVIQNSTESRATFIPTKATRVDNRPGSSVSQVKSATNIYAGVGRNEPCPCGSGKKFKKCHGG
jgi:preprotein translocase subunit SecA